MLCPYCANEWDASKSPCTRCGLVIPLPIIYPTTPTPAAVARDTLGLLSPKEIAYLSSLEPDTNRPSLNKALPRTPLPSPLYRFTDLLSQDTSRLRSPLRAHRLVSSPLYREQAQQRSSSKQLTAPPGLNSSSSTVPLLLPGTVLHHGRYRLHELQESQQWAPGVCEAMWVGQDAQRSGAHVMICEVVLPDIASSTLQAQLCAATQALAVVSPNRHIPTLLNTFSDQGQAFFVFEAIEGDSLFTRMRRIGRALPEQGVIECCLQMTEVLELLTRQVPPLVHGLIRPWHIIARRTDYILTNFSILLAAGATQFISTVERPHLSPYTAPELVQGLVDVRCDLYSLLASAYHLVTGSIPVEVNGSIPQAQRLNPAVSTKFNAILTKGLGSVAFQRYQHPTELLQDLFAVHSVTGHLVVFDGKDGQIAAQRAPSSSIRASSSSVGGKAEQIAAQPKQGEQRTPIDSLPKVPLMLLALPKDGEELTPPEELLPLERGNNTRNTFIWLGVILLCLVVIVLVILVLSGSLLPL